jgi:very-short-patch-repair endonuclease
VARFAESCGVWVKFRRQHPVGRFVVDFACIEAMLVVEIDGYWPGTRKQQDEKRTVYLRAQGFDVVRFDVDLESASADDLRSKQDFALRDRAAGRPTLTPGPSPFQRWKGEG